MFFIVFASPTDSSLLWQLRDKVEHLRHAHTNGFYNSKKKERKLLKTKIKTHFFQLFVAAPCFGHFAFDLHSLEESHSTNSRSIIFEASYGRFAKYKS